MEMKSIRSLSTRKCPECGSDNLVEDYDMGEIICRRCGLVVRENVMDEGPEWRAFTRQEKEQRSRVGTPISLSVHDKGLSTVIDRVNKDAFGRELSASTRLQMLRLRKWHIRARVHSSVDRNLAQAMAELDRLTDKIRIPSSVKEQAALIYRRALDKGLVRGRSILAIAAASLYAACRFTQTPRTLKEVAGASLVKKKDIARCYRLLLRELDIKMPIADPIRCVPKIASRIGINVRTQQIAIDILHQAEEKKAIAGKDPMGVAAAAIYIACVLEDERKTQKEIAEASGVTEVTVRNRYKGLTNSLNLNV
ncbi:MAG: transcription initiation factor IIB [Candidatus Bathyarchaeota archaeon]|nr:MAG: transcription initiation factor IIB [Candidatus Bathyarchaeota archaeon]